MSPVAHERLARLTRVDVDARNRELARYTEAMGRVAGQQGVTFVDLFTPTLALMAQGGPALTINGIHLNEDGDRIVAQLLMAGSGSTEPAAAPQWPTCDGSTHSARSSARRTSSSSTAGVPSTPNTSSGAGSSRSARSTSRVR